MLFVARYVESKQKHVDIMLSAEASQKVTLRSFENLFPLDKAPVQFTCISDCIHSGQRYRLLVSHLGTSFSSSYQSRSFATFSTCIGTHFLYCVIKLAKSKKIRMKHNRKLICFILSNLFTLWDEDVCVYWLRNTLVEWIIDVCTFFQQTANVLLILTAALIGLICFCLGEAKQRRAFVEAKQSLEVKTLIEEQSAEQVNLPQMAFKWIKQTFSRTPSLFSRVKVQLLVYNFATQQKAPPHKTL